MQWNDSRVSSARHCQSRVFIRVIFPMNIFPMNVLSNPSLPVIIYSMAIIYIEKGCNFVFCNKQRNRYSAIIFAKKNMVLWCNVILVGLKILLPAGTFVRTFFSANLRWALFLVLPSGCQPAQLERCQGGGHSLVVRRLWNIHIFSQLDSAAMFLEEMSNWLHIFCEFFYLRIL